MPTSDPWIDSYDGGDALGDARYLLDHATDPLTVLRAVAVLRVLLGEVRDKATHDARALGATWSEIGEASKSSRQAEHRRYADHD